MTAPLPPQFLQPGLSIPSRAVALDALIKTRLEHKQLRQLRLETVTWDWGSCVSERERGECEIMSNS